MIKANIFFLSFFLVSILSGCQTPKETPTLSLAWQVDVLKFEIKDGLNATESVTQYNGSKLDVQHTQNPEIGNVYLIIDVTISKMDTSPPPPSIGNLWW